MLNNTFDFYIPDYYFYIENILKIISRQKYNNYAFKDICIWKVYTTFVIADLVDVDEVSSSNCFFFFKFFFGKNAFFLNYYTKFRLNVLYHYFIIEVNFVGRGLGIFFSFFIHEVWSFLNIKYLSYILYDNFDISLIVSDTTIFTLNRTNLGFFGLKDNFTCKFFYSGFSDFEMSFSFLQLCKIVF